MENKDELIHMFTGTEVMVENLKAELEANGIKVLIKNGFQSGLMAGFGGGIPSAIDIFVASTDAEKAAEIIEAITNTDNK
jgi:phenylpyruvate tautomerase PptA (4-oxalocrotonate tautomerase family)